MKMNPSKKGFTQPQFFNKIFSLGSPNSYRSKIGAGFTLIELLVVIAIIGILAAIGLVALNSGREKARDAQRKTDLGQIRTALNLFYDDHNSQYPNNTTAETPEDFSSVLAAPLVPAYLSTAVVSPTPATTCTQANNYYYVSDGVGGQSVSTSTTYAVLTRLEAPNCGDVYILNGAGFGDKKTTNAVVPTDFDCTTGATVNACAQNP